MFRERISKLNATVKNALGIEGRTMDSLKPMLTYSSSAIGLVAANNVSAIHYQPFATYIAGISAGQLSQIGLIRSIWDAGIDPFIGYFIDRTRSGLGKHRPYMIVSAIPYGFFFMMRFDPFGVLKNQSVNGKMAYFIAIGLAVAVFESLFLISRESMLPRIAPGYFERTQFITVESILNGIGIFPAQIISSAIVGIRSTQEYTPELMPTLLKLVIPTGIVLAVAIIITGVFTKEPSSKNEVFQKADVFEIFKELKQVFRNKAFRKVFFMSFFYLFATSFTGTSGMHFLKIVAERWDLRSQLTLAGRIEAINVPLTFFLTKKYGKKKLMELMTPLLYTGTALGLFVKPASQGASSGLMTVLLYVREMLYFLGISGFAFTANTMFPDVTDVDEMITGRRREATINTIRSFTNQMTQGFMVYVVGIILEWFGVTDDTADKPLFRARATAINPRFDRIFGLKLSSVVIPRFFFILAMRQLSKYKMTKADHDLMQKAIKEKKENGFVESISDEEKARLEDISGQKWGDMWIGGTVAKTVSTES